MGHPTHSSMKHQGRRSHERKVSQHRAEGGRIGDKQEDEKLIKKAMREHDHQQHGGKHTRLKFKDGGAIEGEAAAPRLDRPGRAKGGKTGKGGGKTHVNVIVAPQNHSEPQMPGGGPMGAMAPHPMPAPPPPAAPPPPGPPGVPPGASPGPGMPPRMAGPPVGAGVPMHNAGGRVGRKAGGMVGPAEDDKMPVTKLAGGRSGEGRLAKAEKAKGEKLGEGVSHTDPVKDTAAPSHGGKAA